LNFNLAANLDPDRREYQEGLKKTKKILDQRLLDKLKEKSRKLEEQKKYSGAISALTRAAQLDPDDPELHYALARIRFFKTMDRETAEADISRALEIAPEHIDCLLLMGRIQAWRGDLEAAINTFKHVLSISPDCKKAHQALELFET